MVNIEPYQYQKVTNVKEHNDIVAKINEIIDVINNTNIETIVPKLSALETDVSALDSAVKIQYQDIASIKDKDQAQDNNIGTLDAQVKGITESLVSDVGIIDGTTVGKFKVRLDREKAPSINSNDYDLQKATSIELIQGSGPSMLKAQITLSDGTTLISDDFLFTTEAIGTDVYISSFVFKNGNVAGTISADIGLSNGTTIEANNFVVPMDPSLVNTVQDLSTRLTAVEGGSVAGFKELEAQVNTNKTNIATLTTEIDDLDIKKADSDNSNQTIVAGTITTTNITKGGVNVATINDIPDISGKVDIAQGIENAGKVLVVGENGNVQLLEPSNIDSIFEPFPISGEPPTSSGSYSVTQWSKISVFKAPLGRRGTTESPIIDVISSIDTTTSSITRFRYEMNDNDYVTLANIIKKRYPNLPDRNYKIYVFSASISDYTVEPLPLVLGAQLKLSVSNGIYTVSFLNSKYLYSSKYSSNYVIAIRIDSMSA